MSVARTLEETAQFKRDKKRIKRSGRYDWEKMRSVVKELLNDRPLHASYRDHELSGEYSGVRESHIEGDWLLIYDKNGHGRDFISSIARSRMKKLGNPPVGKKK